MADQPVQLPLQAHRTTYVLGAFIWLIMVGLFAGLLEFGVRKNIDWTFFVLMGPLLGLSVLALILVALRLIRPPLLDSDREGLSLRIGLRTKAWRWAQIESFRLVRTRDTFVALNWHPNETARLKGVWLRYSFPGSADELLSLLVRHLSAARSSGVNAPIVPSLSVEARKAEEERFPKLKRQANIMAVVAIATFICCVVALNLQATKLVTPTSSALSWAMALGVGAIGLLIPISLLRLANARASAPVPISSNILIAVLAGSGCFAMFAVFGSMMADDVADQIAFSGRIGPIVTREVEYTIDHISHPRGGYKAVAYPYGLGPVDLPINPVDVSKIRAAEGNDLYCYPVTEQQSGNAIRYLIPSAGIGNRTIVVPCTSGKAIPST